MGGRWSGCSLLLYVNPEYARPVMWCSVRLTSYLISAKSSGLVPSSAGYEGRSWGDDENGACAESSRKRVISGQPRCASTAAGWRPSAMQVAALRFCAF